MRHTISVLVENRFGVLTRVAGLFSGRGYNIDSLNVAPTQDATVSRMTIVTRGDDATVDQIVKQLQKLANVINVHEAGSEASPHAAKPTPGSGDFCMRWDAPLEEAVALLEAKGIPIVEGPVPRPAADGAVGRSVYFRDPDDNLVEFLSTVSA